MSVRPAPVFAPPDVALTAQPDRSLILRSRDPLGEYPRQTGDWIRHWAAKTPDAVMLGQRAEGPERWTTVTYGQATSTIDRLSQSLINLGLGQTRPLAILSEKSVRHGLLLFAAMQVGIPAVSVSPAYSRRPEARGRLKAAIDLLSPGLIYVEDSRDYADALASLDQEFDVTAADAGKGAKADHLFEDLASGAPGPDVAAAYSRVSGDTVGKILFTSGSTALPKAALITHGNMTSNAQALTQVYPFLAASPPVVVDWQPWHHCGGGCFNLHAAIANGGAYYCDPGRPTEAEIGQTLASLRGIGPTIHFNVPLGYDLLLRALEDDHALRRSFFSDLRLIVYSAAGMPESLWRRIAEVAINRHGERIPMVSSYGMTEMAPMHTTVHWPVDRAGLIGAPVPGCDVKLVPAPDNPDGDPLGRFELRAKGPNISPGYLSSPELSAAAKDEEGWFRSGDAVRMIDPDDPNQGLRLDGRLVEQFKLQSGTWVPAGDIRTEVVSYTAPAVRDVLVVGENRTELGILVFLDPATCRSLTGDAALSLSELAGHPLVAQTVAQGLEDYNQHNPASSRRIARFVLLDHEPDFSAGETTDKGYINQRLAIARRSDMVDRLFSADATFL